ncbi:hypothetical protein BDF22DRAFT_666365 [Syncephalis plumigaleata]|nr:hypothetical protein BDF22DRAFT_666365 [Syncephalis plumigaleata]
MTVKANIPRLSLLCLALLLNTSPSLCVTAVWTTEALLEVLHHKTIDEKFLDRLMSRGILGMKEVAYDDPQIPAVKVWWLSPSPVLGSNSNSNSKSIKDMPVNSNVNDQPSPCHNLKRTQPTSTTPVAKRYRIGNLNKPFKSPLAKTTKNDNTMITTTTTKSTNSLSTPIKQGITRNKRVNTSTTPSNSITNTERKQLLERKRQLESQIDVIETRQRRQAMMATFQRQNKDRSINDSIDKWRNVCQEVIERIRSRIDPQAFLAAQRPPSPPPWMQTSSTTINADKHEVEDAVKQTEPVKEELNYRTLLKILGITDLRLFHYNDEDDCFY